MNNKYAVICARGGSKRVPGKNLLSLNGKPLLHYTISQARQSGLFDSVIVNSDDERILDVARSCGAEVFIRPEELAGDNVFLIDVVRHMLRELSCDPQDEVAILFPTVPLKTTEDIVESYSLFTRHDRKTPVVSVSKYEYPIHTALSLNEEGKLEPVFSEAYKKSTRHNDQPDTYRANYAIIWNTVKRLLTQEKLIGKAPLPYIMPQERSVDIDDHYQVLIAELLLKHLEGS